MPRDASAMIASSGAAKTPASGGIPAPAAPAPGKLSDALRNVAAGPAWPEKRIGIVAGLDDDLADLVDLGPAPVPPAARNEALSTALPKPPPAAVAPSATTDARGDDKRPAGPEPRELSALEAKGRARVAPSVDLEARTVRPAAGTATGADKAMPEHAANGPSPAGKPVPRRAEDRWPTLELPQALGQPPAAPAGAGRGPAARLPRLESSDSPATAPPEPVLPMPSDWRGWPRSAARALASEDGAISAPPTAPVVIAAMPAVDALKAAVAASVDHLPAGEAKPRSTGPASAPADHTLDVAATAEHLADHRFEIIASMAPVARTSQRVPAPPETAPAMRVEPTDESDESSAAGPISRGSETQPEAASGVAEVATEGTLTKGTDEISPEYVDVAAAAPMAAVPPAQPAASSVKDVATALDRLVADLAAAAQPQTASKAAEGPEPVDREDDGGPTEDAEPAASAAEDDRHTATGADDAAIEQVAVPPVEDHVAATDAANPATNEHGPDGQPSSVVSSADAFISGVHAPGEPPRAGMEARSDAMLKLVGTSVSVARHGMDVGAEQPFDDTVADMLRPMIREWLDANMPRILEKAVRKEMAERPRPRAGKPHGEG